MVVGPKALQGRSWAEPKEAVVWLVGVWPQALEGRSWAEPEEAVVLLVVVGPQAKERAKPEEAPVVSPGAAVEMVVVVMMVVVVVMAGDGLQALVVSPGRPSAPNPRLPQTPHWALSLCKVAVMVEQAMGVVVAALVTLMKGPFTFPLSFLFSNVSPPPWGFSLFSRCKTYLYRRARRAMT